MGEKSYVTVAQHECLACGRRYDTGEILLDKRLKPRFEHHTLIGTGLCPEHKKQSEDGFILLVEVDPDASSTNEKGLMTPDTAYRTGTIVAMKRKPASHFLRMDCSSLPFLYIDPGVTAMLTELEENASG